MGERMNTSGVETAAEGDEEAGNKGAGRKRGKNRLGATPNGGKDARGARGGQGRDREHKRQRRSRRQQEPTGPGGSATKQGGGAEAGGPESKRTQADWAAGAPNRGGPQKRDKISQKTEKGRARSGAGHVGVAGRAERPACENGAEGGERGGRGCKEPGKRAGEEGEAQQGGGKRQRENPRDARGEGVRGEAVGGERR
ncbi:PREDICTED: uncharacterized protein LOC109150043 [Ipomoea nil]|uniref:uncharacterized protein LOC109150043 n=1 Tax=Ipomoea nil TaxID=35883 RepID=UPI000900E8A3|nr:PREDICTED: uncharacterized protein LOC109150043 [Ipomoea nil]